MYVLDQSLTWVASTRWKEPGQSVSIQEVFHVARLSDRGLKSRYHPEIRCLAYSNPFMELDTGKNSYHVSTAAASLYAYTVNHPPPSESASDSEYLQ